MAARRGIVFHFLAHTQTFLAIWFEIKGRRYACCCDCEMFCLYHVEMSIVKTEILEFQNLPYVSYIIVISKAVNQTSLLSNEFRHKCEFC